MSLCPKNSAGDAVFLPGLLLISDSHKEAAFTVHLDGIGLTVGLDFYLKLLYAKDALSRAHFSSNYG